MSGDTLSRWFWGGVGAIVVGLVLAVSAMPSRNTVSATPATSERLARVEDGLRSQRDEIVALRNRVRVLEATQQVLSSHIEGIGFTRPSWTISPSLTSRLVTPDLRLRTTGNGSSLSANFQYRGTCPRSVFVKIVGFDGRAFVSERISLQECSFDGLELGRPSYEVSSVDFSP